MGLLDVVNEFNNTGADDFSKLTIEEKLLLRKKIKELKILIDENINNETNFNDLKTIILKFRFEFEPELMLKFYTRYFVLKNDDKEMYNHFLDFLYFYGPEWDKEVEEITELIKRNEYQSVLNIINRINCYCYLRTSNS